MRCSYGKRGRHVATAEVNKKQIALWEQIAVYFRHYDEHLLFAGTNEVHENYGNPTLENIAVQLSYNRTFVDAVRSTGGKNAWRNLLILAYNTNIDHAVAHFRLPTDPIADRLMLEVHYYDPYDFTLDESSSVYLWGKAMATGIVLIYWDNGHTGNNGSGLFNRATGAQVHPDAIHALIDN